MPQVPRYEPNQVQEQIAPVVPSNIRTDESTFGGGPGVAQIAKVGSGLVDVVEQVRKRSQDALKSEGESLFSKLQIDTSTEIKLRKGKDAVTFDTVLKDRWDKGVDETLKNFEDEDVKSSLKNLADLRRQELYQEASKHMVGEVEKYEQGSHKAYVESRRNEAVYYYQDPQKVKMNIALQRDSILTHAKNLGYSPEQTKLEMDEAESKTHLNVLTRMINNGEDLPAKEYMAAYKDKVVGVDLLAAEKILEEGTLRGESQRQSDKIVATSPTMTDALDKARDIEDPKLRDETIQRVKQRFTEKKQADDQDTEQLHMRALNTIDKGGTTDTIPREEWARFSAGERNSLIAYASKKRDGIEPETSWTDYYELKNMASDSGGKADFIKTNLMTYRSKMADAEFKELVKLQADLRKGKDSPALDGYRTENMIVNDSIRAAGFSPSPKKGSSDAKSVALFRAQVDSQIKAVQERTGKKASNEEVQNIVDNLLVEVVTKPGYIFDTKKRVFELDPSESGVVKIKDVPRTERQKIESALKARNIPVTEQKILELYSKKLQGLSSGS